MSRLELLEKRKEELSSARKDYSNKADNSAVEEKPFSFLKDNGEFKDSLYGYDVNTEFKKALNVIVNERSNTLISGSGGVGKSTFLEILDNIIKEKYHKRKKKFAYLKTAPTGIAGLRIGGMTLHRAFSMPIKPLEIGDEFHSSKKRTVRNLDLLIIDEVSMVRSDLFTVIDYNFRSIRSEMIKTIDGEEVSCGDLPFGGCQIVLVGDLYQLPPVVPSATEAQFLVESYGSKYFFNTDSFRDGNFVPIEFNIVYRQKDQEMKDKLNTLRTGLIDKDTLNYFNSCHMDELDYCKKVGEDYVYLTSTNKDKDSINQEMLSAIKQKEEVFYVVKSGNKINVKTETLFEDPLRVKVGAQVMAVVNGWGGAYYNGQIGKVVGYEVLKYYDVKLGAELENLAIMVDFYENSGITPVFPYKLSKKKWVYSKEEKKMISEELGSVTQYPLALAWARTIHKSQSQTYEKCYVDFGKFVFSEGLVYTALSRCKSHENLGLARPIKVKECSTAEEVRDFYFNFFK